MLALKCTNTLVGLITLLARYMDMFTKGLNFRLLLQHPYYPQYTFTIKLTLSTNWILLLYYGMDNNNLFRIFLITWLKRKGWFIIKKGIKKAKKNILFFTNDLFEFIKGTFKFKRLFIKGLKDFGYTNLTKIWFGKFNFKD